MKHEKMGEADFEAVMNGTYVEPAEEEDEETVPENAETTAEAPVEPAEDNSVEE